MKLVVDPEVNSAMSCLVGYLDAPYESLVKVFGEPTVQPCFKTDAEWAGTVNGKVFTIYNYKNGKSYLGEHGADIEDITSWNIGGRSGDVAEMIRDYFNAMKEC